MDEFKNNSSIKNLAISGFKWFGALQAIKELLAFVVNIILARILLPSDFGLIALVTVITSILLSIVEIGFNAAVIQRKEINDHILSTAFFINLVMSLFIVLLLFFTSPYIGIFFVNEAIVPMIRFFSIVLIIRALSSIQIAIYERNLDFQIIAYITITGVLIATFIKIYLAVNGFGAWSVILGEVCGQLVLTILLWMRTPWIPRLRNISSIQLKGLFSYGSNIMLIRFFNILSSKIDVMVIGRFISSTDLGFYSMGFKVSTFIPQQVNNVVTHVMFPSFSRLQDDNNLLIKAYLEVTKYIALLGLPAVVGLIIITPEFVSVVLTDNWVPSIPIIQILCVYSMANVIGGALWSQILKAKGMPRLALYMTLLRLIVMPFFIIAGLSWGLIGVAAGIALYGWVFRFVYQYIVNKIIRISMLEYIKSLIPAFVNVSIMTITLFLLTNLINGHSIVSLIFTVIMGIFIYISSIWFFNRTEFYNLWEIAMSKN